MVPDSLAEALHPVEGNVVDLFLRTYYHWEVRISGTNSLLELLKT